MNIEPKRHKTILVTGGTGFLGSYLLRYLVREGYGTIRALKRADSRMNLVEEVKDRIDWMEGDVMDIFALEDAMKGVDQVYHCAAVVSFHPGDVPHMMKINIEGTANVINTALEEGIKKLIHVSSIAAIGRTKEQVVLTEKNAWQRSKFHTHYAISKFLGEQEVWRGIAEGLNAAIVNPSVILGGGRWKEGPLKFFPLAWRNFPFYPAGTNGFVDVRDVARIMIQLMESPITAQRFIVSAENLAYQTVMKEIASRLGKRPPFLKVTPWIGQIASGGNWLQTRFTNSRPLINRETATISSRHFYFSNKKSIDHLGFEYTPVRETIADTAKLFLEVAKSGFTPKTLAIN